jgi:hypothetical protein
MGVGETFVALAGIVMITTISIVRTVAGGKAARRNGLLAQNAELARELAETQTELRALKDRVGVLERLVTDPEQVLARQINGLSADNPSARG